MKVGKKRICIFSVFIVLLLTACGSDTDTGKSSEWEVSSGTSQTMGNTMSESASKPPGDTTALDSSHTDTQGDTLETVTENQTDTAQENTGETENIPVQTESVSRWNEGYSPVFPSATGQQTYGSDIVLMDASNISQGYVMIQYSGINQKVKLQITGPNSITYTYDMAKDGLETFPLTSGNGAYKLAVYENLSGTEYALAFSQQLDVVISDELLPYLYPNKYVWYNENASIIPLSRQVTQNAVTEIDAVQMAYNYLVDNYKYDYDKADSVKSGYLPNIEELIKGDKGICFDYASIMTAILRIQGIPTRLEVGYCGEEYHAWISVYTKDQGWVNGIIECDKDSWNMMDPTFAASSKSPKNFTADSSIYTVKYVY